MRKFCPNCGTWSFGYDPKAKVYRCYTVGCGFVDLKRKYGDGLSGKPSNPPHPVEKIFNAKLKPIKLKEGDK